MAHHEYTEVYIVTFAFLILALHFTATDPILTPFKKSKLSKLYKIEGDKVFLTFFSIVKASTMFGVTFAILAVDFPPIFERIHSKSEEFGISVMDAGVALITLNAGVTSRKARPWFKPKSFARDIVSTLYESLFHVLLGFMRILMLKSTDYQEHASEYGIHWNFYTTIALVNVLLVFARRPEHSLWIGLALMIAYELCLAEFGL